MGGVPLHIVLLLFGVALTAGFVDTIAGGGGMLTIPALLLTPSLSPEMALATNKLQSSCGSTSAAFCFWRKGYIHFKPMLGGMFTTAVGAAVGVILIHIIDSGILAKVLPLLLITVAGIFIAMPTLGDVDHAAKLGFWGFALGLALPIGFYDGFLGPGSGSFYILALIAFRGETLRQATMEAKVFNAMSNLTALTVFIIAGHIVWSLGVVMGVGQMLGAKLASGLVISRGSRLIRPMVIIMSVLMSLYLAYRNWFLPYF